jgi:hypothetical protein
MFLVVFHDSFDKQSHKNQQKENHHMRVFESEAGIGGITVILRTTTSGNSVNELTILDRSTA